MVRHLVFSLTGCPPVSCTDLMNAAHLWLSKQEAQRFALRFNWQQIERCSLPRTRKKNAAPRCRKGAGTGKARWGEGRALTVTVKERSGEI